MTDETLREIAIDIARGAGRLLLDSSATGRRTKSSPTDLVTDADRAAEKYIFERIRSLRPNDSIISEEGSVYQGSDGNTWVVDPLDGTVNFVYDIPQWCVSIGIEGHTRVGVVYDPNRDELFTDIGPHTPSTQTRLAEALIATGFSYRSEIRESQGGILSPLLPQVRDIRRAGSCALDLCWVAAGRLDGFFEMDTHHWDISAGLAIVEGAGGVTKEKGTLTIAAGTLELLKELEERVSP